MWKQVELDTYKEWQCPSHWKCVWTFDKDLGSYPAAYVCPSSPPLRQPSHTQTRANVCAKKNKETKGAPRTGAE